jgi:hypothetical protein
MKSEAWSWRRLGLFDLKGSLVDGEKSGAAKAAAREQAADVTPDPD